MENASWSEQAQKEQEKDREKGGLFFRVSALEELVAELTKRLEELEGEKYQRESDMIDRQWHGD